MLRHLVTILFIGISLCIQAQTSDSSSAIISPDYIKQVSAKASHLDQKLDKQTSKAIAKLQKHEEKMKRKLAKLDSLKAEQVFGDVKKRYSDLEQKLAKASSGSYIPSLDSMSSSLGFLSQNPQWLGTIKDKGLSAAQAGEKIEGALEKVKGLKEQLSKAESLQQFIKERKDYFKDQLSNLGFAKELKKLNKQAYYYSQQLSEYKSMLKDHKKAERKALELLSKTKLFKDFMRKNSQLASLFRMPGDPGDPSAQASLAGLQTRTQVSGLIGQQLAAGGPNAQAQLQQNLQQAQGQLNELKNKINQLGGSSSSDAEMPDGFRPNSQKVKSLWDRLEYGSNVQSQKGTGLLPVTSDIGLSVGYKLNDKSIIGIGGSYKLGWGENIRNIKISHQGVGLRSFIEYKLPFPARGGAGGGFWLSGGYEQNYRSEFRNIEVLKDFSAWQQSGLIGLSKVISLKTKLFKKTNIKLLWDFLSYQQIPRTQPILFRVGYNF